MSAVEVEAALPSSGSGSSAGGPHRATGAAGLLQWDEDRVVEFFKSIGMAKHGDAVHEHGITGDVLVRLDHELLKDMGVTSMGKRIKVLKAVYQMKLQEDLPLEDGDWVPPSGLGGDEPRTLHSFASRSSLRSAPHAGTPPSTAHSTRSFGAISIDASLSVASLLEERDSRISTLEGELRSMQEDLSVMTKLIYGTSAAVPGHVAGANGLPSPYASNGTPAAARRGSISRSVGSVRSPTTPVHPLSNDATPYYSHAHHGRSGSTQWRGNTAASATSAAESPRGPPGSSPQLPNSAFLASSSNQPHDTPSFSFNSSGSTAQDLRKPASAASLRSVASSSATVVQQQPDPRSLTPTPRHPSLSQVITPSLPSSSTLAPPSSDQAPTDSEPAATASPVPPSADEAKSDDATPPSKRHRSAAATAEGSSPFPKSFRVTIEDPCWRVLPAVLRKYRLDDDPKRYVLFLCYGSEERCLGYEEKPLLLFQKLRAADKNPVFTLRHIKDLPNPVAAASAKQRQRLARHQHAGSPARVTADAPSNENLVEKGLKPYLHAEEGGSSPSSAGTTGGGEGKEDGKKGKDGTTTSQHKEKLDARGQQRPVEAEGFAVAIYPYMADGADEFDVSVGDAFTIIGKLKGWWVCARDRATPGEPAKSGWVPSGCLLETTRSFAGKAGQTASANGVQVPTGEIVSQSTASVCLMDFAAQTPDEVSMKKGETVRVYKKYTHWSFVVNPNGLARGWAPSWLLQKPGDPASSSAGPSSATSTASHRLPPAAKPENPPTPGPPPERDLPPPPPPTTTATVTTTTAAADESAGGGDGEEEEGTPKAGQGDAAEQAS